MSFATVPAGADVSGGGTLRQYSVVGPPGHKVLLKKILFFLY